MIQGMNAALSGLRTYINQTNTAANNLANLNTPGFKGSRIIQAAAQGGQGVRTTAVQTIQSQGSVILTGQPFDMAAGGDGFFRVVSQSGAVGYTRAGAFHVDKNGRLADANGNTLQPEVRIPGGATGVSVERDGSVTGVIDGQRQAIGQIELVRFSNPSGLERGGGNIFLETAASGQPVVGRPGADGVGEIFPASLETSNVDIADEMVNLIQAQHGVSAQVKTIQTADEMLGAILDIKA